MHCDLVLMLLADARLPVAGHTQSGTLEAAIRAGLQPGDIPAYVATRLRTVTFVEAGTAVVARAVLVRDGSGDRGCRLVPSLHELEWAWEARTPSPALREAARRQGRALLRLAVRLWPGAAEVDAVASLGTPPRAVVLAALAAHLGVDGPGLARLVGYDDVQTVCAAALKLAPLDPAVVAGWSLAALGHVEDLAAEVGALTEPGDLPATGNPQFEAWAQAHAATTRRLFHA